MIERQGAVLELAGDGRARGRGHAALGSGDNEAVRRAIIGRLRDGAALLGEPDAQRYLNPCRAQWGYSNL